MAFATTEDLRIELGLSALTSDQTTRAQRRLDAATAAIQRYTRQTISRVTNDVVELRGTWASDLHLPEVPVVSVSSVVVETETFTAGSDYSLVGNVLWRGNVLAIGEDNPWRHRYPPSWDSHWGGPETVVTVTYTHGFASVPDEIAEICLNMACRGWDTPTGMVREQIGAWSAQYGPATAAGAVSMTREERRLLRDLRARWQSAT